MNELRRIKNQIAEFEDFKKKTERRQLEYPLDITSKRNIQKDVVIISRPYTVIVPAGLATYDEAVEVSIDGKTYLLETTQVTT